MYLPVLATTANALVITAFGFVLLGLAVVWFRYSARSMVWTRNQAVRLHIKRDPLRGDERLLIVSRWSGAGFLVAIGLLLAIGGLANL